ncbi:hypothetical protein ACB092_03G094800 [Castanea dentata]
MKKQEDYKRESELRKEGRESLVFHAPTTPFIPIFHLSITLLQRAPLSVPYLHNHLPNNAKLNLLKRQIPNPPYCTGLQSLDYFTRGLFGSSLIPLQRKSLYNFSMRLATFAGIGRRERRYVGKLERVLFIRVSLPPLDRYNLFHPANLCSTSSKIGFHIVLSLKVAPKGRPKYFRGSNNHFIERGYFMYMEIYTKESREL